MTCNLKEIKPSLVIVGSSAASEMQHQLNGALVLHAVVGKPASVHHLPALVEEPLLARLHPLSGLHLLLEARHGLVGLDVVLAQIPGLVFQHHLDGRGLREQQQRDATAGLHTEGAEGPGVIAEGLILASAVQDQPLPHWENSHLLGDHVFQGAHCVPRVHRQTVGCPIQHHHAYIHDT